MLKSIGKYILNSNADYVVFEDISLQTNVSTLLLLARIQGSIIQTCINNDIPYRTIKPTTWRKILGFRQGKDVKRANLKQQAVDYVEQKYNLRVKDDVADAICLGEACILSWED